MVGIPAFAIFVGTPAVAISDTAVSPVACPDPSTRMPAPAVYVIAILGTVGVAIAFKEVFSISFLFTLYNYLQQFVYPHIAPHIDRWKAEFQAAKERRGEEEGSAAMSEIALTQQGVDKDRNQEGDGSYSDHSDVDLKKGSSSIRPPVHPNMKNGLLIRRRGSSSESSPGNSGDVELDWITGASTATELGSQQQDLRLRKINGSLYEVPLFQPLFEWNFHFSLFSTQV